MVQWKSAAVVPTVRPAANIKKAARAASRGILDGSRDLSRAKCRMKKCCLTKGHVTCVDCAEYESCETIQSFLNHPGYKYGKYKQALEYIIRAYDYITFLKAAEHWKMHIASTLNKVTEISSSAR